MKAPVSHISLASAILALPLLGGVAGCGDSGTSADDHLAILSPHWEGIQREFERGFEEHWRAKTGRNVEVTWLDQGGTSQILRYIRDQYSQDSTGIGMDMMFGGGIDPHLRLVKDGFTDPYILPDSILSRVPKAFGGVPVYDSTGQWYGATMSGFGIIYNKAVARLQGVEPPQTWEKMADPRLCGWIAAGDPRMSGSIHMAFELMLQSYGWEKGWQVITAIMANTRSYTRGATEIPLMVARGDAVAGMCIDFYAWSEVTHVGSDDLSFVYPVNLTAVNPDAICILRGAPHRDVAREFLTFVMSEAGQRIWAFKKGAPGGPAINQLNRFAVMPDLYERYPEHMAVDINPFAWEITFVYDSKLGSTRWNVVNDLIGTLFIDSHIELHEAWDVLRRQGTSDEGLRAIAAMPLSGEEALELAARWNDQGLRNAYLKQWTDFARAKYEAVKAGTVGGAR